MKTQLFYGFFENSLIALNIHPEELSFRTCHYRYFSSIKGYSQHRKICTLPNSEKSKCPIKMNICAFRLILVQNDPVDFIFTRLSLLTIPRMAKEICINFCQMPILAESPNNLKEVKYFDLFFCHNHSLTKPNICAKFKRNR